MEYFDRVVNFFKKPIVYCSTIGATATAMVGYVIVKSQPPKVKLSTFLLDLKNGAVKEIIDYGGHLSYNSRAGTWFRTNIEFFDKTELLSQASKGIIDYSSRSGLNHIFPYLIQIGCIAALYYVLFSGSRSGPKKKMQHQTSVTFQDIAGNTEAKNSLQEIIEYFKNPEKFLKVGAKLPRGVLLYGPPGTGKTMLAKATAAEAGVNFIQTTGSEYMEIFVGMGAKRVRDTFAQARKNSPCILFIDEIEGLAMRRDSGSDKANLEHLTTINQLLAEMDGFIGSEQIVVLGATNNHRMIDEAILRPGRFDRKIIINTPRTEERLEIFCLHLKNREHSIPESFIRDFAERSDGMTGADISGIINEACYISIREKNSGISTEHINTAFAAYLENQRQFKERSSVKSYIKFT